MATAATCSKCGTDTMAKRGPLEGLHGIDTSGRQPIVDRWDSLSAATRQGPYCNGCAQGERRAIQSAKADAEAVARMERIAAMSSEDRQALADAFNASNR